MYLQDWLRQNSWALLIACITLVGTYYSYGNEQKNQGIRISALEEQVGSLQSLKEQVARIDERTKGFDEDLQEIKVNMNSIIRAFKITPQ